MKQCQSFSSNRKQGMLQWLSLYQLPCHFHHNLFILLGTKYSGSSISTGGLVHAAKRKVAYTSKNVKKKKKNKNPFYSIFSFMQMHKINICQILFCVLEGKPLKKTELQPYKHPSPLSITSPQLVIFSLLKILTIPKLPSSALILS